MSIDSIEDIVNPYQKPKNKLNFPGPWMIIVLVFAFILFLLGGTVVIKFIQLLFYSPMATGGIPIWAIFVVGGVVLLAMRRKRIYGGYA